jgi:hypothetical protein
MMHRPSAPINFVFLDETGMHGSIGIHSKGWVPRGKRPRQVKPFHHGQRFQILPAYTQEGVIHFQYEAKSASVETVYDFKMDPQFWSPLVPIQLAQS